MVCRNTRFWSVFALAVTSSCSPKPPATSPAQDATAQTPLARTPASEPPPEPSNRWTPEVPALDAEAGFAWAPTQLGSACERYRPATGVIESADVFRASFCLEPDLDWSRFRVAVFARHDGSAERATRVVAVVRNAEHWLVIVEPSGACCSNAWDCEAVTSAIIPASPLPVQFVSRASSMPACVAPRDGYGY